MGTFYAQLDMKTIRDTCGLDFAHYTYRKGQKAWRHGPLDMATKYWAGGKNGRDKAMANNNFSFILFRNADDVGRHISSPSEQEVHNRLLIMYRFKNDHQKNLCCELLAKQLGEEYAVEIPENESEYIVVWHIPTVLVTKDSIMFHTFDKAKKENRLVSIRSEFSNKA